MCCVSAKEFLKRWLRLLGVVAAVAYVISIAIHFYLRHASGGVVGILDVQCKSFPGTYGEQDLDSWLRELGEGRTVHVVHTVFVDTVLILSIYPFLAACFVTAGSRISGFWEVPLYAFSYMSLVPMVFDIGENILILHSLRLYSDGSSASAATILSHFTVLKLMTATPVAVFAFCALLISRCFSQDSNMKTPDIC